MSGRCPGVAKSSSASSTLSCRNRKSGESCGTWVARHERPRNARCSAARNRRGKAEPHLACGKKNAAKQVRLIVFVDESGLSERPTRVRSWVPRGQTPVIQYSVTWEPLPLIAGVSLCGFYFRLFPGTIKAPQRNRQANRARYFFFASNSSIADWNAVYGTAPRIIFSPFTSPPACV